jgi:DNA-binding NtrC family response regulator
MSLDPFPEAARHAMVQHLIIVEDDNDLREIVRHALVEQGYEVRAAVNSREGLALHTADPANLIITDIVMSDGDGLELIDVLRKKRDPAKVIAISGGGVITGKDYLNIANGLGVAAVLEKPFKLATLLQLVRKTLGE